MNEYLIIPILFIISYLLGAIPFAHIFTKLFSKKDILKIGWKKSSSSNVLANIGKVPALLTFLFDVLKGFIVVFIAKELGLPFEVLAIAGFLAVIGHNFSIFLNFNGGRGIATILGACLAFNPFIAFMALIPVILTAIFWTASIGTLFSYLMVIFWSYSIQDFGLSLLFALSLIPIIIKRVLPIKTLRGNIFKRIVFDQDSIPPFRIK
ncbi:MAG: glycerol-3-phosphate acyltransferase [Candidatus Pacebacteria bacterium]|nr:glycerol-3-phosphate acyltransferase [Candidatus Paceibacterota bacterium]